MASTQPKITSSYSWSGMRVALDQRLQHVRAEIGTVHMGQAALAPSGGAAHASTI
jgi:hypothetical protein